MRRLLLIIGMSMLGATLSSHSEAEGDEIAIIVNKANPAKALDRDTLRPLFQTTQTRWSSGTGATPVNLPEDSALRKGFDAAVLGLDPERSARYWTDRKIRGGERPPRKASSASAVLRAVSEDAGGVGYVAMGDVTPAVKIIGRIRGGQVVAP